MSHSPGIAAVLSFFWTGLGQIYNGQIVKGMLMMLAVPVAMFLLLVSSGVLLFTPLHRANQVPEPTVTYKGAEYPLSKAPQSLLDSMTPASRKKVDAMREEYLQRVGDEAMRGGLHSASSMIGLAIFVGICWALLWFYGIFDAYVIASRKSHRLRRLYH